jgi:hypothetical protein
MTTGLYQNYNLWDRLQTCIVGRSWPAEFYSWIPDSKIRSIIEQIAIETEEDCQDLIKCLTSLGVKVVRPNILHEVTEQQLVNKRLPKPPMCPGDNMIMLGNTFFETVSQCGVGNEQLAHYYNNYDRYNSTDLNLYSDIFAHVANQGNTVESVDLDTVCAAMIYQLKDKTIFSMWPGTDRSAVQTLIKKYRSEHPVIPFHYHGHVDGWFAPVTPGLIISSADPVRPQLLDLFYKTVFPSSEIIYLEPTVGYDYSFIKWQKINKGNWWIPGQENNSDLNAFINDYFDHWLGEISETVFEVNMIVVDDKNVIVSNYNEQVFKKFEQYGVTAHVSKFRHQNFWDSGINCLTCALHRSN